MKKSTRIVLLTSGIIFGTIGSLKIRRCYNDHLEHRIIINVTKRLNVQSPDGSWIIKDNNGYHGEISVKNERYYFKTDLNGKIINLN